MNGRIMSQSLKWISALVLLGVAIFASMLTRGVPPPALTDARMNAIRARVCAAARSHGVPPANLEGLPQVGSYTNSLEDGWGNRVSYTVDGDVVTLTSFGSDGRPGGSGPASDIVRTFHVFEKRQTQASKTGEAQRPRASWERGRHVKRARDVKRDGGKRGRS
jgi:hypothetical protein